MDSVVYEFSWSPRNSTIVMKEVGEDAYWEFTGPEVPASDLAPGLLEQLQAIGSLTFPGGIN